MTIRVPAWRKGAALGKRGGLAGVLGRRGGVLGRRGGVIAGAALVLMSVTAGPALAIPQFGDVNYRCDGQSGLLLSGFDPDTTAATTSVRWGVPDYTGYLGDAYASSRIRILGANKAIPGQQVTRCTHAFSGRTIDIVLLSPVPAAPPGASYHSAGAPADPGVYKGWVVRSVGANGCFPASPLGELDSPDWSSIRLFCMDAAPELWDIVNIDYDPSGESRLTVRGTLTSLK